MEKKERKIRYNRKSGKTLLKDTKSLYQKEHKYGHLSRRTQSMIKDLEKKCERNKKAEIYIDEIVRMFDEESIQKILADYTEVNENDDVFEKFSSNSVKQFSTLLDELDEEEFACVCSIVPMWKKARTSKGVVSGACVSIIFYIVNVSDIEEGKLEVSHSMRIAENYEENTSEEFKHREISHFYEETKTNNVKIGDYGFLMENEILPQEYMNKLKELVETSKTEGMVFEIEADEYENIVKTTKKLNKIFTIVGNVTNGVYHTMELDNEKKDKYSGVEYEEFLNGFDGGLTRSEEHEEYLDVLIDVYDCFMRIPNNCVKYFYELYSRNYLSLGCLVKFSKLCEELNRHDEKVKEIFS